MAENLNYEVKNDYRLNNGEYYGVNAFANFWSSTEDCFGSAYSMHLSYDGEDAYLVYKDNCYKVSAYSVRCVKNQHCGAPCEPSNAFLMCSSCTGFMYMRADAPRMTIRVIPAVLLCCKSGSAKVLRRGIP